MEAIIDASDAGGRLAPLAGSRPATLLPLGGTTLLGHALDVAAAAGVASFVVAAPGATCGAVREALGDDRDGVPISYVTSDGGGPVAALRAAREGGVAGPVALLSGRAYYAPGELRTLFEAEAGVGTAVDPARRGRRLAVADDGRVQGLGTDGDVVDASAYTFPGGALDRLDAADSMDGVLRSLADGGSLRAVPFAEWVGVDRPFDLLTAAERALADLDRALAGEVHEAAVIEGAVAVEEGARVRSGAVIEGPALIRRGATVGPNAYIRGPAVVGPDASVGHAVEVANSVLMAEARVNHLSFVGHSLLGRDADLGGGTVTANLRHDGAEVELTVDGVPVSTGRSKFGSVVGEGVRTGANTSLNVGVTLPAGAWTLPGEAVLEDR